MQVDQGLTTRMVRFDLDDVDFYTATEIAGNLPKPSGRRLPAMSHGGQRYRGNARQYERLYWDLLRGNIPVRRT